jgi:hypothetical protein
MAMCAYAQDGDVVTLENRALQIRLARSPAPHIAQLIHKATGTSVVSAPAVKDLFVVAFFKEDGSSDLVESSTAGQSSMNIEKVEGGARLTMTYSTFPKAKGLAVQVTITCLEQDPLTRWTIGLANNTGRKVSSVRFPIVTGAPAIGSPDDDFIVLPYLPGALIENPAKNWRVGQSVALPYPGMLSAQFIAYQDRTAGVYLAGMDAQGYPMSLAISKRAEGLQLHHEFSMPADAEKGWSSPYSVSLGVTQGTWCDTADIYKSWAVRQPWCARTLAQRDDVPAWWKAGPDVHVCEVRTYDSKRACTGSYYPKLLDHLRTFQAKIDGPIVAMLAGWENHRRWTAGDYFPIFDRENAKKAIAEMKKEGFRPFFYLSGLFYTFENEGVDGSKIPHAEKYLPYFVVDPKTGRPREFKLDESNPGPGPVWRRHSYEFCVGVPFTREFFRGVIDQAHELGVDVLQMDQTVQGAGSPCYTTQHGHTPGIGLYESQAFQALLQDLRAYGKGKNADFALFHEEPHEQLIQCLDGFHVREYKEKWWYRGSPGAVGIPLFSYLYHEYAIGYGGDSAGLSKDNVRANVRAHAVNLVTGRTPGGSIWWSPKSMYEAHPDQIRMIRNHCRLLKTRAKDYLMLGRMLHPYELDVPKVQCKVWPGHGKPLAVVEDPAILTSSWQSPDGGVGHLFVNISEAPQTLKVGLDTRNAPCPDSRDVDVYSSEQDAFQPLWKDVPLPKEFTRNLAPGEAVFVEVRRTGKG